jgi:hypothetical protein
VPCGAPPAPPSPPSGNGTWDLVNGDHVAAKYRTEHLRISFVWRSRCFSSEDERATFLGKQGEEDPSSLTVEQVLDTLVKDLRRRYDGSDEQARGVCVCVCVCVATRALLPSALVRLTLSSCG